MEYISMSMACSFEYCAGFNNAVDEANREIKKIQAERDEFECLLREGNRLELLNRYREALKIISGWDDGAGKIAKEALGIDA
jgi:hypothetical protein